MSPQPAGRRTRMSVAVDMTQPPSVRISFGAGSYEEALRDYETAKWWCLDSGLCFDEDLVGVINSPTHLGETPPSIMSYENGWMSRVEQDGWATSIDLWCNDEKRLA